MIEHLKRKFYELLLCLCSALCLTYAVSSGFELGDAVTGRFLFLLVFSALVLLLCAMASYSPRSLTAGIIAEALCLIALVLYCNARSVLSDELANSAFLYVLISLLSAQLTWLLSRTKTGCAVLALAGTLIIAGAVFLQFPVPGWCGFLFPLFAAAQFLFRVYLSALAESDRGSLRLSAYFGQTAVLCLAALLLAGGFYAGVIRPLSPPTRELKLISALKSMDRLEVLGVYSVRAILDPSLTSDEEPEQTEYSDQQGQEQSEALTEEETTDGDAGDGELTFADTQEELSSLGYEPIRFHRLWLLLLIPLALAGAVALHLAGRRRWHRQVRALPPEESVVNYYRFFLKRMARLGLVRPGQRTLREYARDVEFQTEPFDEGDSSFQRLTEIYEKVFYGRNAVNGGELQLFEDYYGRFYHNLRRELGSFKYCLNFFRC